MHFYCNVHNLYKELAEHEIKLNAASRSCMYEREKTLPWCLMSIPQAAHWENLVRVELQTLRQSNYIEKWKAARMTHLQVLYVHADILTFNLRSRYPAWRFSVSNCNLWLVQSTWSNFAVLSWSARQWRFMSWSSTIVGHWRCFTWEKFILHHDQATATSHHCGVIFQPSPEKCWFFNSHVSS